MQKRISIPLFFVGFFLISFAQAQVKIGDNPQTIDPASILELESSDKVLVITRVDSLQMTTIVPNRGALVYNTTADCVYYYDGAAWISMCEGADGGAHTATPIVNSESTIVITPTAGGNNFEIAPNSITSDQILNGGINGVDIQNGSIGRGKLAPNAVDKARIAQNAVGPYAIDRDSLPLSFFNNDAGFITGANVVSGDADNSISVGSDSGAFFDATFLEDNIAANTAAIAADGDKSNTNEIQTLSISGNLLSITNGNAVTIPTADGSDTNINEGNNITITGNGTAATPYVINAANEVDGSITNELITGVLLNASNQLVITEAGTNTTVDLSSLAGGGALAQINSTATVTVSGDGSAATPYTLAASGGVTGTGTTTDPFSLSPGAGGQWLTTNGTGQVIWDDLPPGLGDDQNAGEVPVVATAVNYTAATPDVEAHLAGIDAALAGGGGGSTEVVDGTTLTGTGTTANPFKIEPSVTNGQFLTTNASGNVIWANVPATGTTPILSEVLATGNGALNQQIKELLDPTAAQDAATKAYVDATVASGGTLTDGSILVGGAGDVAQQLVLGGDATLDNAGELTIADDVIESANILDGTIDLADLGQNSAADGDVMRWDDDTTSWIVEAAPGEHSGTPMALFYADATTGLPTTAFNPNNGDILSAPSLIWDQSKRVNSGALGIGIDGGPFGNFAKVQIMEGGPAPLSFPLQIQKESGSANTAAAILFAVDSENAHGKGAVAYERLGAWGVGDFHFLQNTDNGSGSIPTLADKAFTVKNNGDIQVYGNIIAQNGPGAIGQVLTTDASGQTVWGTGGGSTDDQNIEGSVLTGELLTIGIEGGTNQDVDLSSFATEAELTAAVAASAALDNDTDDTNEIELPTGGANGNVLSTNGAGVYSWIAANGGLSSVNASTSFTGDGTSGSQLDIANDVIGTDELAVNAVFEENINANAVTSAKIAPNTIAIEDLSPMGATANGQVLKWDNDNTTWTIGTDDTTAGGGLTAVETTTSLTGNGTTGSELDIATDAIGTDELAFNAVFTENINAGAVTADKIGENEVTVTKIAEGTDGEVLTTNNLGEVIWADPKNLENNDVTLTEDRTIDLDGNNLSFDTGGGNIGIGALPGNPQSQLDVNGSIRSRESFLASPSTIASGPATPSYGFYTESGIGMYRAGVTQLAFTTGGTEAMRIDASQNVGIGTDTPAERLHVAGSIQADGDFISNNTTIQVPDYVFQKYFLGNSELKDTYNFTNLEKVEAFIKENHHLPGVTSAVEAMEKGQWNLSASNLQNLEKIEELFLHTIEQEKEIKKLKAEKEAMAKELKSMKNDIEEIKALLNK